MTASFCITALEPLAYCALHNAKTARHQFTFLRQLMFLNCLLKDAQTRNLIWLLYSVPDLGNLTIKISSYQDLYSLKILLMLLNNLSLAVVSGIYTTC